MSHSVTPIDRFCARPKMSQQALAMLQEWGDYWL